MDTTENTSQEPPIFTIPAREVIAALNMDRVYLSHIDNLEPDQRTAIIGEAIEMPIAVTVAIGADGVWRNGSYTTMLDRLLFVPAYYDLPIKVCIMREEQL